MGTSDSFTGAIELAATVVVLLVLRWAAIQRAIAHREWATRQRKRNTSVIDWWVATWAVAGCL